MKDCWPTAVSYTTDHATWFNRGGGHHHDDAEIGVGGALPHSAPSSCNLFSTSASCRRAASFPLAQATALPSALKVRSQSESAALNNISIKVPRSLLNDFQKYRQSRQQTTQSGTLFGREVTFFAPIKDEGRHSDSEGDDSLVSSDVDSSSSGCEHDADVDAIDLGVGDLELDVTDHLDTSNSSLYYFEPPTPKKSVRFADDCGAPLTTVRVMTEPSDYPPRISPSVIRRYKQAANESGNIADDEDEERRPKTTWKMGFSQPASEYVKFRETLEKSKVALENVIIKNDVGKMVGTIKVANISFEKRVFVRFTCDAWKSYMDRPAVFQSSASKNLDTFRFDIELPQTDNKHSRIEFCVCFAAGEAVEYWDSNGGKNYVLTSPDAPAQQRQAHTPPSPMKALDRDDAYRLDYNNWTNFASWKNLSTDGPYW
ncbi:Protein H18N23.2 a [Aphelenchoides avenae]|nr:Protein H18N23.2 a [Aphelenchus avenae]